MQKLKDESFMVFDVETTGLSVKEGDRIVEIAAIRFCDSKIENHFESLVNPQREISCGAFKVNGITQDMLASAPLSEQVLPKFFEFAKGSCLIAHNLKFDLGFVNNELFLAGKDILDKQEMIDTLKMSRKLMPFLGSYSLQSLAYYFGIKNKQQHRALADVEATLEIFLRLMKIAEQKDISDMESLVRMFGLRKSLQKQSGRN